MNFNVIVGKGVRSHYENLTKPMADIIMQESNGDALCGKLCVMRKFRMPYCE
jgi:hypothetical protein